MNQKCSLRPKLRFILDFPIYFGFSGYPTFETNSNLKRMEKKARAPRLRSQDQISSQEENSLKAWEGVDWSRSTEIQWLISGCAGTTTCQRRKNQPPPLLISETSAVLQESTAHTLKPSLEMAVGSWLQFSILRNRNCYAQTGCGGF